MQYIKMVICGDGAVGKTSLLIAFAAGEFPRDYQPTVFDNFSTLYMFQNKAYNLGLFDTAGQEDFDRLRPLGYSDTDLFIICYSVINPPSYANVYDKWYSEIKLYTGSDIPLILVGTQNDLRHDKATRDTLALKQQAPISYEEGMMMRKRIGAKAFTECSVVSGKNVKQVFEEAIKVYQDRQLEISKSKEKNNCIIL
ncbi:hypothetical protein ACTFIU_004447 [Dictyostelium citrinum]